MLSTITRLRPNRSIMAPPSRPNTPPASAAIQSVRPIHRRTSAATLSGARSGLPAWISSSRALWPMAGNINSS